MPVFKKSIKKRDNESAPLVVAASTDDFGTQPVKQLDSRLGMDGYRDFYTLKNYWKTVHRRWKESHGLFMYRYLKTCPEAKERYQKLNGLNIDSPECSEPAFETIASNYLKGGSDTLNGDNILCKGKRKGGGGGIHHLLFSNPIYPMSRKCEIS
ncbi:hypothetical protein GPALN_011154 [Globodera pallida]|nr:hypothetical protein GPALN_011154 [Globodera pallida]